MSSSNKRSYEFLRSFNYDIKNFGEYVKFDPMFYSTFCQTCISGSHFTESENCVSGGRYCAPEEISDTNLFQVNGSQVMVEDLMQHCINKLYPSKFFDYASSYLDNCLLVQVTSLEDCTSKSLKSVGISRQDLKGCYDQSFNGKSKSYLLEDNTVLGSMRDIQNELQIPFYPYLLLNNVSYRVTLCPLWPNNYIFRRVGRAEQLLCAPSDLLSVLAGAKGL